MSIERPAAGGDGLGHLADGRVVFVPGALPGERVEVAITRQKRDFARARIGRILEPSPDRVVPPCPFVAAGCGGCDLQHVRPSAQLGLKAAIVADSLRRIGRLDQPDIRLGAPLPHEAFRTTVRAGVDGGRAGFRRAASHEILPVDHCLVAHPAIDELLAEGRFADATEVTLRVGGATGERLALVTPTAAGVQLPDDVRVVGADELAAGGSAWFHDEVAGERLRISAESFFQTRTDGAAALVHEVVGAIDAHDGDTGRIVDAYSGVGLFAAALTGAGARPGPGSGPGVGTPQRQVVAIERSRSSVADAEHNLAGRSAEVIRSDVERWRPTPADVVVADPSRVGLGRDGVDVLAATGAPLLVLISCDVAPLGRDARLLVDAGYTFGSSTLVDLFPHTHHIEVVTTFHR